MTGDGLVDVHAHCLPAAYLDAVADAGLTVFDGGYHIPRWTEQGALRFMDRHGVAVQVLSVSSPPVAVLAGADAAAGVARRVNDEVAEIVARHPDRFRGVATLPLPNLPAALDELDRVVSNPAFVAVGLFTNHAGSYLGDPLFEPVFAVLDDHPAATVVLHPTSPPCADHTRLGRPAPLVEFPIDTTRAVTNLVWSGTLHRHPHVRIVVPHAGAAVPAFAWRIAQFADYPAAASVPGSSAVMAQLRGLYFDLAMSVNPHALAALLALVDHDHILFGTDYPFAPPTAVISSVRDLATLFTAEQRAAVGHRNALRVFPGLPVMTGADTTTTLESS